MNEGLTMAIYCVHGRTLSQSCKDCYAMLAEEGREGSGMRYVDPEHLTTPEQEVDTEDEPR